MNYFAKILLRINETLLLFLMFGLPLAAGAKFPWTFHLFIFIAVTISASALLIELIVPKQKASAGEKTGIGFVLVSALLALACFQMLPLSSRLVDFLAPGVGTIFHDVRNAGVNLSFFYPMAVRPAQARIDFMLLASYILVFLVVKETIRKDRAFRKYLLWSIFLSGTFQALFALTEYQRGSASILGLADRISAGYISGSFVNPNHFAYWMELTIPFGMALLYTGFIRKSGSSRSASSHPLSGSGLFRTWFLVLAVTFMVVAGVYSRSTAGIIMIPSILIIFPLLVLIAKPHKFSRPLAVVLAVILLLSIFAAARINPETIEKEISKANYHTLNQRVYLWNSVKSIIGASPVFGYGMAGFPRVFSPMKSIEFQDYYIDFLHNDWLELIVSNGFLGFILVLAALIALWRKAFLRLKNTDDPLKAASLSGGLVSISLIAIHSLVDFGLKLPAVAFLFTVILAVTSSAATQRRHTAEARNPSKINRVLIIAALLLCLPALPQQLTLSIADLHGEKAQRIALKKNLTQNEISEADSHALSALALNAYHEEAFQILGEHAFLRSINPSIQNDPEELKRSEQYSKELFQRAIILDPADFRPYLYLATIASKNFYRNGLPRDLDEALKLSRFSVERDPLHYEIYAFLAELYGYLGQRNNQAQTITKLTALHQGPGNRYLINPLEFSLQIQDAVQRGLELAWEIEQNKGEAANPYPVIRKAQMLFDAKEREASLSVLQRAMDRLPGNGRLALAFAGLLQRDGRIAEAAAFLENFLDRMSHDPTVIRQIHGRLFELYKESGRIDDAVEIKLSLARTSADPVQHLKSVGLLLIRNGRAHEAVKIYQTAIEIVPSDPELELLLARAYFKAGDPKKAAEIIEDLALRARTAGDVEKAVDYYLALAEIMESAGNIARSTVIIYEAHLYAPRNISVLKALAWNHFKNKDYWESLSIARQALQIEPGDKDMSKLSDRCLNAINKR